MYDVNNHPRQKEVNDKIARILANTINELKDLSKNYNIDAVSLATQYKECFDLMYQSELAIFTEKS